MKKLILTTLASCVALAAVTSANAAVTRLTSYDSLMQALKNGHRVNAVADDSKCFASDKSRATKVNDPDYSAILGISFTTNFFLQYQDDNDPRHYVASIATNTIAADDGAHIRYKRIRVYDDNSVELNYSNSESSGKLLGAITFTCGISNGKDKNGVSLFDYDAV